ncbi:MAG: reverse transcriptase [Hyphomonadaceae bacterium]|nr:reverse transcriptase [Hyphomonadaceae bacterium]MBC6412407.1 reverse transcriptase [Hyphomonadaceae bacterium]
MLDQSFSADNFRKVFDLENRKGNYLEGKYFPDLAKLSRKVRESSRELRKVRRNKNPYTPEEYQYLKLKTKEQLKSHKSDWEGELATRLKEVSSEVCDRNFSFGLMELNIDQPKKVFVADKSAAAYFALKQMQFNIRRVYKVKQSSRHQIICQIRELLCDELPKYIVRTDVESFYESIPREQILRKLRDDPPLTLQTKKLIRRVLHEYGQLTGNDTGLPRGTGISAYLAELYMRDLDASIRNYPGVLYYARYVDDIVIMFCPPPNVGTWKFRRLIVNSFKELGLRRNRKKTKIYTSCPFEMTYLGYNFHVAKGEVKLRMSDTRVARYKRRVGLAFSDYKKKSEAAELSARRLLKKRIDFLTGNTRLVNNKKNVVSGIYFSNSLLTDCSDLCNLDDHLQAALSTLPNGRLKNRLQKCSFVQGFKTRRYKKFSARSLFEIVEVWKHAS